MVCMAVHHHLIIKATNDVLLAVNSGSCVLLPLLDLSAALYIMISLLHALSWPVG